MATILDKDLIRESTVKHDGREIVVTLTENQSISFRLKGMKSGDVSISIAELYSQLIGGDFLGKHLGNGVVEIIPNTDAEDALSATIKKQNEKLDKSSKDNPMISLYDLRVKSATTPMNMETKALLDGFIVSCIKEVRQPFIDKENEALAMANKRK